MEQQCLLLQGCCRTCLKAFKTFKTIGNTKKFNGETRFINAGMLAETLEGIGNLSNYWKYKEQLENQCFWMRGCCRTCWKALKTTKTVGNNKKCNGKTRLITAGILAEILESIEHLWNHWKYIIIKWKARCINAAMLAEMLGRIKNLVNHRKYGEILWKRKA